MDIAELRAVAEANGLPHTTFASDLRIAEAFGIRAVEDTLKRAFEGWREDIEYMTALAMETNWRIWLWHGKDDALARVYDKWWRKLDSYILDEDEEGAFKNYSKEDIHYYIRLTD